MKCPQLHLSLETYPHIESCLQRLEGSTKKPVLQYADPLIAKTGCDTIGELLDLIYTDAPKFVNNPIDTLEDYIKKSMNTEPPRRIVKVIGAFFEENAYAFEVAGDPVDEDYDDE
jgi:hypothetical protein